MTVVDSTGDDASALAIDLERGVVAVPGLRAAGVAAGIKPSGSRDVALLVADEPRPAAAVFTRNRVAAAPVQLSRTRIESQPWVKTVVVNAGNANALTGARGLADAREMLERADSVAGGPSLVLSTGVIGHPLPMDRIRTGIDAAAAALDPDADDAFAEAILTTDTTTKRASVTLELPGWPDPVRVGGTAKGSGMIHPDMATMLAVVATDAPLSPAMMREILVHAVDRSFHRISVDGDTSTNDAVVLLGGRADPERGIPPGPAVDQVADAITAVCRSLAHQIILDGEGMTRVLELDVRGAGSEEQASAVGRAVATSSLVKTALAGGDPNWGRILAAAGNAGVDVDPNTLSLSIEGHLVVRNGEPLEVDEATLRDAVAGKTVHATLDLGPGPASVRWTTTDLTHDYVTINAEYTT